jgi:GxxExxY protein
VAEGVSVGAGAARIREENEPQRHRGHREKKHRENKRIKKMEERDPLTDRVIGAAIEVHRILGPGLLESVYQKCLCHELALRGIAFQEQVELPVVYKGVDLGCNFVMDIVVEDKLVLELKAIEKLAPIHEAQLLTYLRLSGIRCGLLLNFHQSLLRDGIKRMVL